MPIVFVPREIFPEETRVAAVPETVRKLVQAGNELLVESGAGLGSSISDAEYQEAGAKVVSAAEGYAAAEVVVKLHAPDHSPAAGGHEADFLNRGALLISFLFPFTCPDLVARLRDGGVSAFAMDQVPRISRAQKMDALTSQANIAGYKAVIMAAEALPKLFPLLMTAAGTIKPARVVVLGAGVAGLQAIATARRLGAVVEVSDVRYSAKEQVQSLGGKFIEVEGMADLETAGGYAREASADVLERQRKVVREHLVNADVIITTALVPGKPAPKLVAADVVQEMRPGSVIVDLAVDQGGNCELSEPGKVVVKHGVTLIGRKIAAATVPVHASEMYSKNVLAVLQDVVKDGRIHLDFNDEVVAGAVVVHGGEIRLPALAEMLSAKKGE